MLSHFDSGKLHVLGRSPGSDLAILACQTVASGAASLVILEGHLTYSQYRSLKAACSRARLGRLLLFRAAHVSKRSLGLVGAP